MAKATCTVCNAKRSKRNVYKGVCRACRSKGLTAGDKLPCAACGDIEYAKRYKMGRYFCPRCLSKVSWINSPGELSLWLTKRKT